MLLLGTLPGCPWDGTCVPPAAQRADLATPGPGGQARCPADPPVHQRQVPLQKQPSGEQEQQVQPYGEQEQLVEPEGEQQQLVQPVESRNSW